MSAFPKRCLVTRGLVYLIDDICLKVEVEVEVEGGVTCLGLINQEKEVWPSSSRADFNADAVRSVCRLVFLFLIFINYLNSHIFVLIMFLWWNLVRLSDLRLV